MPAFLYDGQKYMAKYSGISAKSAIYGEPNKKNSFGIESATSKAEKNTKKTCKKLFIILLSLLLNLYLIALEKLLTNT